MPQWNFGEARKPEVVELFTKLVTIKGPKDWTQEKREEALKSFEGFMIGALKVAQRYHPGLEISIEPAPTRTRRRL